MWKREVAGYEQFFLFPQCFQKTCTAHTLKTRACLGMGQWELYCRGLLRTDMGSSKWYCYQIKLDIKQCSLILNVALQILGRKFFENTKKSSLYAQSLLNFFHKTPVVENHPTTTETGDILWPKSTPTGNMIYFYIARSFTNWKYTDEASNLASV